VIRRLHHAAIIASDYARSKRFYTEVLGLRLVAEHYRAERDSWKLDLVLPDGVQIELFTFPNAPRRLSYPEAQGLRHLAFEVSDIDQAIAHLHAYGIEIEPIRIDEASGQKFTFFKDPDGLPLELYESPT
jgi:glyoxylase I family protein